MNFSTGMYGTGTGITHMRIATIHLPVILCISAPSHLAAARNFDAVRLAAVEGDQVGAEEGQTHRL